MCCTSCLLVILRMLVKLMVLAKLRLWAAKACTAYSCLHWMNFHWWEAVQHSAAGLRVLVRVRVLALVKVLAVPVLISLTDTAQECSCAWQLLKTRRHWWTPLAATDGADGAERYAERCDRHSRCRPLHSGTHTAPEDSLVV